MISFFVYFATIAGHGAAIDLDKSVITLEGDIMIERGFIGSDGLSSTALSDRARLWPSAQIYYKIDNKFGFHEQKVLQNVIHEIESKTCLAFSDSSAETAYINITRLDERGCESFIGYKGEMQEMFLNKDCFIKRGTILHELMHALGFVHEHTRPDRDDFVDIIWDNIQPTEHARKNFYKRQPTEVRVFSTYAYDSVMHYGETFFSKNGKPTIVPKKKGVKLGGGNYLSKDDIQRINQLYECKDTPTLPTIEVEETCFNDYQCCSAWKEMGQCTQNVTFMSSHCKASCAICSPKYNLYEDCSDRHRKCDNKVKSEGCQSDWMRENCRLTCNTCSTKAGLLDKCNSSNGQCRDGWTLFNDNCYVYKKESGTFSDAQDSCVDKGAYLTSIHSKEENDFITKLMSNQDKIWIGTYKDPEEETWLNMDDTEVSEKIRVVNLNFFRQTSFFGIRTSQKLAGEIVVQLLVHYINSIKIIQITNGGKWIDVDCNESLTGFVCKKKKQK